MNIKVLVLASLAIGLNGCVNLDNIHSAQTPNIKKEKVIEPDFDVRNTQQIEGLVGLDYDEFRKESIYMGPVFKAGNKAAQKLWFLRKIKTPTTSITQIYVEVIYNASSWYFLDNAASNGIIFDTTQINRKVVSCSRVNNCLYIEDVAINIDLKQLRTLLDENGVVKFGIKDKEGRNWVIDITKEYIDGFENAIKNKTAKII